MSIRTKSCSRARVPPGGRLPPSTMPNSAAPAIPSTLPSTAPRSRLMLNARTRNSKMITARSSGGPQSSRGPRLQREGLEKIAGSSQHDNKKNANYNEIHEPPRLLPPEYTDGPGLRAKRIPKPLGLRDEMTNSAFLVFWVPLGSIFSLQARIPPARFLTLKPACCRNSAAFWLRPPDLHCTTISRLLSSSPTRFCRSPKGIR